MNDELLEIISIISIIAGIILGYFFIFDYSQSDVFMIEGDEKNGFLEAMIIGKIPLEENTTLLQLYACKYFDAYSKIPITKTEGEQIIVSGEFSNEKFYINKYK